MLFSTHFLAEPFIGCGKIARKGGRTFQQDRNANNNACEAPRNLRFIT